MKIGRRRPLTAAQQFVCLQHSPVCAGAGELRAGRLEWRYATSPSPVSRLYCVRIAFTQGDTPNVYVDGPDLIQLADGRKLPHVYGEQPPRLCLYRPRKCEWQSWMRIDQTVVPWTTLWLFYFEEWLESDDWKGGGEHPPLDYSDSRRSRSPTSLRRHRGGAGDTP